MRRIVVTDIAHQSTCGSYGPKRTLVDQAGSRTSTSRSFVGMRSSTVVMRKRVLYSLHRRVLAVLHLDPIGASPTAIGAIDAPISRSWGIVFGAAADAVHSRTSYSNATPSGSFSSNHLSAAQRPVRYTIVLALASAAFESLTKRAEKAGIK